MRIDLRINGQTHCVDVEPDMPLLWVLRERLGLRGTKFGCGAGLCGACTVHLDGNPMRSCLITVANVARANIVTIEGVGADPTGRIVQAAWAELDVAQCGYCQPGQIMAATALLKREPEATAEQIDGAMGGNLCRCGTYNRIRAAIRKAAALLSDSGA